MHWPELSSSLVCLPVSGASCCREGSGLSSPPEHVPVPRTFAVSLSLGNCQESGLSIALLAEPLPLAFAFAISNSTESPRQQVPAVSSNLKSSNLDSSTYLGEQVLVSIAVRLQCQFQEQVVLGQECLGSPC